MRANPGPIASAEDLQAVIAPAVRHAQAQMHDLFAASEKDVAHRVEEWSRRLDQWDQDADALIQRSDLKQRRITVQQERQMVAEMNPDRQLVRPLLVVVPETGVRA
jgi:hypothetical protein